MDKATEEFYNRIHKLALLIPRGKVATYGQLAFMAGNPRGARAAGRAMKFAPADMDIPCHRVVNKSGEVAPGYVFEGRKHQRRMLETEGVEFRATGRIDMKKCLWDPDI